MNATRAIQPLREFLRRQHMAISIEPRRTDYTEVPTLALASVGIGCVMFLAQFLRKPPGEAIIPGSITNLEAERSGRVLENGFRASRNVS
jgi:hypothetical protein